jgi:hypothetical protein
VGVKQGDCVLKVFLLRLGVGGGKNFFSGKNFRLWFGGVQQRRAMFSGQNFLRLSILLFRRARRSDEERTIRSTEVADEGRGRVKWGSFSLSLKNVFEISFFYNLGIG